MIEESSPVLDQMSLSAWPSSKAGKRPDFALVIEHFLDDQVHRIDGSNFSFGNQQQQQQLSSNFAAVARCDVLRKCCTAFAHHFSTYRDVFTKMQACVDVIQTAFDEQHRIGLEVEKFRALCVKREETLRAQMREIVERHEREYASEAQLKVKVAALEAELASTKTELEGAFRSLAKTQEQLSEVSERNEELSRNHVILTLRESKMRETADALERSVAVSHSHAEAKAREVGELRQEIATIRGHIHHIEAQLANGANLAQTSSRALERKTRELEERDMQLARLNGLLRGGGGGGGGPDRGGAGAGGASSSGGDEFYSRAQVADKVHEALSAKEAELKELQRTMTPRPDWDALAEKYKTKDLVKMGNFAVSTNAAASSSASSSSSSSSPSTKLLRQSTRRWCDLLASGLCRSAERCDEMQAETHAMKEKADSLALELSLAQQKHAYSKPAKQSGGAGGGGGGAKRAAAGGAAAPAAGGRRGGAAAAASSSKSSSVAVSSPVPSTAGEIFFHPVVAAPDYLGRAVSTPVKGRIWTLQEVYLHLATATDFIVAHLTDHGAPGGGGCGGGGSGANLDGSLSGGSASLSGGGASALSSSTRGGGGLGGASALTRSRWGSLTETQLINAHMEKTKVNMFEQSFHAWLSSTFRDAAQRQTMAYCLVYHTRTKYESDIFCRLFALALGGDCCADVHMRVRVFVNSFRRSFEMVDSKCCGFVPKKSLANLVKSLMGVYSAVEQRLVLALLDELPTMASRAETLVDYRPLFNGTWDNPTQFMELTTTLFFRNMIIDCQTAINAVRAASASAGSDAGHHCDISVGTILSALQSCDPKRDLDVHKDFVSRCIGQSTIKSVRVPVESLVSRMRRAYLPRASAFPSDPTFHFPSASLPEILRTDQQQPKQPPAEPSTTATAAAASNSGAGH